MRISMSFLPNETLPTNSLMIEVASTRKHPSRRVQQQHNREKSLWQGVAYESVVDAIAIAWGKRR